MTDTGSIASLGHFIRGSKRHLPPFRIVYNRRRGTVPLHVKDGRGTIVGSFTRWRYAFACLEELHRRAGLQPPYNSVARRRFEEDIWDRIRKHPHSKALAHINDGL
jgi:hypothetical protein